MSLNEYSKNVDLMVHKLDGILGNFKSVLGTLSDESADEELIKSAISLQELSIDCFSEVLSKYKEMVKKNA